jgi:hypothetical protein
MQRCPYCYAQDPRRSRRHGSESALAALRLRRWRCQNCGTRFWTPRWLFGPLGRAYRALAGR